MEEILFPGLVFLMTILYSSKGYSGTAAVVTMFILLNPVAGIASQLSQSFQLAPEIVMMPGVAVAGGLVGSHFRSFKITDKALKYALSVVLIFASYKLLFV